MPKISVIMSVYNDSVYLKKAIDSILAQTYADFEFLITDDGSTDNSASILDEYAARDQRVKVVHQKNIGLTRTLNNSIKQARGMYIARMDSDDIAHLERFEKQVKYLEDNPEVALVSSFTKVIDTEGKEIGQHCPATTHAQIKKMIFFSGQIAHPAAMFRKDAFLAVGGYNENFKYAQDLELWLKLIEKYKVANIPEFLLLWRRTPGGISVAKIKEQQQFAQLARRGAVRRGMYPRYYMLFLLWPHVRQFIPEQLKNQVKRIAKD